MIQIIQMITEQTLLLMKPQRKPFFLIFQSETCCKLTLVTRYYSGKVLCHAIELLIDYEHRYLTTCNSIQVQSVKLLYVVFFFFFSIESFYIE